MAVVPVDLGGVPLAEGMCADALIPEVITNVLKLFLYLSFGDGEQPFIGLDAVKQEESYMLYPKTEINEASGSLR